MTLNVRQETDTVGLYFIYEGKEFRSGKRVFLTAKTDLKDLMRPFARRKAFDNIFIAQDDGRVIYQQEFPVKITSLSNLGPAKAEEGKGKAGMSFLQNSSSRVADVSVAGTEYKMFLQPIQLTLPPSRDSAERITLSWTVGGLVRAERYLSEAKEISYFVLIVVVFLGAIVIASLPLLKLRYMGPKDHLRLSDIFVLGASALVGSALLAVFLIDLYAYRNLEHQIDYQLQELAETIAGNFKSELQDLYRQLEALNTRAVPRLHHLDAKPAEPWRVSSVLTQTDAHEGLIDLVNDPYPYFGMAFWIDGTGQQRAKWSVHREITPFINLRERSYVRHVWNNELWNFPGERETIRFWLEPVYSLTTGENTSVLAMPLDKYQLHRWIGGIESKLVTLTGPVLPPGFGYAVIDETGRILFHTQEERNLQDNLFEETDQDPLLRAAVFGHASEWMNTRYEGRGYRFYVIPVDQLPWSLVVYRDKEILRTTNLEILTVSMILFIGYISLLLVATAGVHLYEVLQTTPGRLSWLWPAAARRRTYLSLLLANVVLTIVFLLVVLAMPAWQVLLSATLIPAAALVITWLIWKTRAGVPSRSPVRGLEKRTLLDFRVAYVLSAVSFLIVLGVLPALAFFKVASDKEVELLIKHGQLGLAREIENRLDRIKTYYREIDVPNKRQFIERRAREQRDLYYRFYFQTEMPPTPPEHRGASPIPRVVRAFNEFLALIRVPYNQYTVESRELTWPSSADDAWRWDQDSAGRLTITKKEHVIPMEDVTSVTSQGLRTADQRPMKSKGPGSEAALVLTSIVPAWSAPQGLLGWLLWGVVSLGFLAAVVFTVQFVARKVFFLFFERGRVLFTEPWDDGPLTRNLILLAPPFSGKSRYLNRPDFYVLDLRRLAKEDKWADKFDYGQLDKLPAKVLAVDHFEYKMGDAEDNWQKLKFLEEVLATEKRVVLAATTDPLTYPIPKEIGSADGQQGHPTSDRWAEALSRFLKVQLDDDAVTAKEFTDLLADMSAVQQEDPKNFQELLRVLEQECSPTVYLQKLGKELLKLPNLPQLSPDQLIEHILDQAQAYYRVVWANLTTDERFVLYCLANDGFINSSNPEIDQLLRKRVITFAPNLRLMNESFRRFVLSECCAPEYFRQWKAEEEQSRWHTLKGPLLTVIIAVVTFLYLTQRELFDSTIAFAAALTAGLPTIFRLLGFLERDRGTNAPTT